MSSKKVTITMRRASMCPLIGRVYAGEIVTRTCRHPKTKTGKCATYPEMPKNCPGVEYDVWMKWVRG